MHMNILVISNKVPYPLKDGGSIATFNLMHGFIKSGHKVTMLTLNTKKHYVALETIPESIRTAINLVTVDINTDVDPFKMLVNLFFSNLPFNAERFIYKPFFDKIEALLLQNQYDVVQLEGLYLCPYIPTIRKHSKALISYRAHNIEHEIWNRSLIRETNWLKQWYLSILTRRLEAFEKSYVNSYDVLVPITPRDADTFAALDNHKPVHVAQTGYDLPDIKPNRTDILFPSLFHLGALDWFPNQEGLIWFLDNVWPDLLYEYPNLRFHIAGRNAPTWLKHKFIQYRNIVFMGEIESAFQFMSMYAIMVVPLLSGGGMRIKIIEGLALGKTIVSSTLGAEGIPAIHGKEIMIADTPEDFKAMIVKLLNDRALFDEVGANASSLVSRNFDNQKISTSLLDFYKLHLKT